MKTLRIYDLKGNVLSVGLKDLLRLLAPRSLAADWTVSTVKSSRPGYEWFDATGEGGARLEALAQGDQRLSGADLAALAEKTRQVLSDTIIEKMWECVGLCGSMREFAGNHGQSLFSRGLYPNTSLCSWE